MLWPGSQSYGDGGYELTKLSASLVSIAVLGQSADLIPIVIVTALHQEATPPQRQDPEVDGLALTGQVMPGVIRDRMKLSNLGRGVLGCGYRLFADASAPRLRHGPLLTANELGLAPAMPQVMPRNPTHPNTKFRLLYIVPWISMQGVILMQPSPPAVAGPSDERFRLPTAPAAPSRSQQRCAVRGCLLQLSLAPVAPLAALGRRGLRLGLRAASSRGRSRLSPSQLIPEVPDSAGRFGGTFFSSARRSLDGPNQDLQNSHV